MGEAESVANLENEMIHSMELEIPVPRTIRLVRYVYVKYAYMTPDEHSSATLTQVLRRDRNKCGYCGDFADTVDHIMPSSRGGMNTWGNLIAACFNCNQFKADRTPDEAGVKLLWPPKAPRLDEKLQKTIWKQLEKEELMTM